MLVSCLGMDVEWLHWRNVFAIIGLVMAIMLLIFDCRYTECPPLEVEEPSKANNFMPGGPTVAINFGIGGDSHNSEKPKQAEVKAPSPKNQGDQKMFGVDEKNKYSLPQQQNSQNNSNDNSNGGLAPPIY